MNFLSKLIAASVLFAAVVLQLPAVETNGLFYTSSGEKADIQVFDADVYSQDNSNTFFGVNLSTSSFEATKNDLRSHVELRINNHKYLSYGWGNTIPNDHLKPEKYYLWFGVPDRNDAESIAKLFSAKCLLRSSPDYKYLAQFVPLKEVYHTNEPVLVSFTLKNLDNRTIIFDPTRPREYQYNFSAFLNQQSVPVLEYSDSTNLYTGFSNVPIVSIAPGNTTNDQVNVTEWLAFDKAGIYQVHGVYHLYFCTLKSMYFINQRKYIWDETAAADFQIVVK
jgi:hypothetical protein